MAIGKLARRYRARGPRPPLHFESWVRSVLENDEDLEAGLTGEAQAQRTETAALRVQIEDLRRRVEELERSGKE